jgi:regulator of protease activity HflC (stomatin/prohibitin superfamily)
METISKIKIVLGLGGLLLLLIMFSNSCERIDAGHVGVKVNLYGDGKGIDDITEVTGIAFYNPFSQKIYEFPTFVQHKEYTKTEDMDESFVVNSKDGSEFHVSPIINYSVKREKVPYIFGKYRRDLSSIEEGFLKTTIYDAFRMIANSYTADEMVSQRQNFENKVRHLLDSALVPEGFIISQMTSNLGYPKQFKDAIIAKNNAIQLGLTAENRVKTAQAEAKIKVATAEGNAQAMLTQARAEAESNRLKQSTLTPMLLQQMWIEKWNGVLPSTQLGSGTNMMYNVK